MKRVTQPPKPLELRIDSEAVRQIRQHGRSSTNAEICGVLVGAEGEGFTTVEASIPGAAAVEGGTHVTFTQDTWEHIYRIKDRDYPQARILGWYHSHPGFGVFLSDHDTFIHKNFFSSPRQIAWVYDPHSDEEGCFGWVGESLERLPRVVILDEKGGEGAGETGKPEPVLSGGGPFPADSPVGAPNAPLTEGQALLKTGLTLLAYLCVFLLGFLLCWYIFPRYVGIPVDPYTGQPLLSNPGLHASPQGDRPAAEPAPQPNAPPAPGGTAPSSAAPNVNTPGATAPAQGAKGKP